MAGIIKIGEEEWNKGSIQYSQSAIHASFLKYNSKRHDTNHTLFHMKGHFVC